MPPGGSGYTLLRKDPGVSNLHLPQSRQGSSYSPTQAAVIYSSLNPLRATSPHLYLLPPTPPPPPQSWIPIFPGLKGDRAFSEHPLPFLRTENPPQSPLSSLEPLRAHFPPPSLVF